MAQSFFFLVLFQKIFTTTLGVHEPASQSLTFASFNARKSNLPVTNSKQRQQRMLFERSLLLLFFVFLPHETEKGGKRGGEINVRPERIGRILAEFWPIFFN